MNRNILIFIMLSFIISLPEIKAQCTPNPSFTNPGIYPDSTTNLPPAVASVYYETVINVVVPVDTVIAGFTVPIDSIGVTSFAGLPSGFTWASNTPSNYWHGGSKGCVVITGNPVQAQIGTYNLTIGVVGKGGGFSIPYTIDYYKINILDSVNAGINTQPENYKFKVSQNSPNPFNNNTEIKITSKGKENVEFTVTNLIGKVVYKKNIFTEKGENTIVFKAEDLPAGIYMYRVSNELQTITKRMIIQDR